MQAVVHFSQSRDLTRATSSHRHVQRKDVRVNGRSKTGGAASVKVLSESGRRRAVARRSNPPLTSDVMSQNKKRCHVPSLGRSVFTAGDK